jgi:hypothetical protein
LSPPLTTRKKITKQNKTKSSKGGKHSERTRSISPLTLRAQKKKVQKLDQLHNNQAPHHHETICFSPSLFRLDFGMLNNNPSACKARALNVRLLNAEDQK